jgi:hypothetical protein
LFAGVVGLATSDVVTATETRSVLSVAAPSLAPAAVGAAMASSPAAASPDFCWFCNKYEAYAYNDFLDEYEWVMHAYCEALDDQHPGGAVACFDYANMFNVLGEWEGGTCWAMWRHEEVGWEACDCSAATTYAFEEMFVENCFAEVPAAALSSDGYLASSQVTYTDESDSPAEKTCNGAILNSRLSDESAQNRYGRLSQLTI